MPGILQHLTSTNWDVASRDGQLMPDTSREASRVHALGLGRVSARTISIQISINLLRPSENKSVCGGQEG